MSYYAVVLTKDVGAFLQNIFDYSNFVPVRELEIFRPKDSPCTDVNNKRAKYDAGHQKRAGEEPLDNLLRHEAISLTLRFSLEKPPRSCELAIASSLLRLTQVLSKAVSPAKSQAPGCKNSVQFEIRSV